ncbi:MAG: hypothetical protein HW380_469 [Magnetococcales bacterium]|nr:hypothetical protein [Magnetococcales bacterium]
MGYAISNNDDKIDYAVPELLLVPTLEIFSVIDIMSYYDCFIRDNLSIKGIVLPIIEPQGTFFTYTIQAGGQPTHVEGRRLVLLRDIENQPNKTEADLRHVIENFQKIANKDKNRERDLEIYFLIYPDLPQFAHDSNISIQDQSGFQSAQTCIYNPLTRKTILHILAQAFSRHQPNIKNKFPKSPSNPFGKDEFRVIDSSKVKGIILYAGDLWPVSAKSGRFQLTCFCKVCTKRLETEVDVGWFKKYPSPANLALAESGDEGKHLMGYQPVRDLTTDLSKEAIVDRCSQVAGTLAARYMRRDVNSEGRIDEQSIMVLAGNLKKYLTAKSKLTVEAISSMMEGMKKLEGCEHLRSCLIVEAEPYMWTTGTFFTDMKDLCQQGINEVWVPPNNMDQPGNTSFRPLLANRACYFVSHFLTHLAWDLRVFFATSVSYLTLDEKRKHFERARDQVLSELPENAYAVALPPEMKNNLPSVVVGLSRDIMDRLIREKCETNKSARQEAF